MKNKSVSVRTAAKTAESQKGKKCTLQRMRQRDAGGMQNMEQWDVIVIGAGVVGAAAARELARFRLKIGVLEKEDVYKRQQYAYTLLDLESRPKEATIEKLKGIKGVLRVRTVK